MNARRTARTRRPVLAAALVAGALLLGACSGGNEEAGAPATISGAELDEPYVASPTALTDTSGEARALGDVDGDLTLVFFGYTNCPDICGIVMSTIATAVNKLDADDRDRVDMVFVTTDPARDDQKTLRTYLDRYDPTFEGLTGDLDDVIEVGRPMSVLVEEGEKLPSGGYEVVHSDHVIGLDAEGEGIIVWNKETSSAEMASDIELLLDR